MKKNIVLTLAVSVAFIITCHGAWAQESATDEFTLEEIIVTSEKREVNVQSIPASVQALPGADLVEQGKVTVGQFLENVPNVEWADSGELGRGEPNNNITIRGIKRTQEGGGPGPIPSATSVYVDGVFDGIGANYDIERIEVLRGPQGTLYGRSSTGGVVAFHTNNPKLDDFGGNVMVEYGSGERINVQSAINVPISDKVALRAALHYLHQGEGYRFGEPEGENEAKEARIKALFQPTEQFSALLSLSATKISSKTGGYVHRLTGPDEIVYKADSTDVGDDIPNELEQASIELNYDLGDTALTYIGAIHTLEFTGTSAPAVMRSTFVAQNVVTGEPSETQTHEIRWASDTDGRLSWLIGANYYEYTYEWKNIVIQNYMFEDDDPATIDAEKFGQFLKGDTKDSGIFTEETFELRDDMRITAGLRYDKTKLNSYMGYDYNMNQKLSSAHLNPPDITHFPSDGVYELIPAEYDNITYKLRFEYDLTPENMLYATTSTGFLPGAAFYLVMPSFSPLGITGVNFTPLAYDEEKLTSYELGSKNRFLNDKLQVNGALFYMDYEGYQEAVNVREPGGPTTPQFAILRLPVEIYGLEVDLQWLLTQYDKVAFTGGWLKAEATAYPQVPVPDDPSRMTSAEPYMALKKIPGLPEVTANLIYDHTFLFGNGSSLVPRGELRYISDYYLSQATQVEVEAGYLPYLHRDSVTLFNIGATWFSPGKMYSITGYLRNATDEEYKTAVGLPSGSVDATVSVGDPRTWGINVGVKF